MILKLACRRYRRIESEARERGLTQSERAHLDAHALACRQCRARTEQLRAIQTLLAVTVIEPSVSPDFTDKVVERVRAMRRQNSKHVLRPLVVGAVSAAVAIGAVLQVVGVQAEAPKATGSAQNSILRETPIDGATPDGLNLFDSPSRLVRDPRPNDV